VAISRFIPLVCLISILGVSATSGDTSASQLYKQGKKAEKAGEMARAYLLYSEAAAKAPEKSLYWLKSQAVRSRAALESKAKPAVADGAEPAPAPETFDSLTAKEFDEARKPLPPTELKAQPGRKDIDIKGDSKTLFEQVARAYGLDTVFDSDYQPTPSITFRMQEADYREALHALETATGSFIVPLGERLFLVVKDTPPKRAEMEPSVTVLVPIPEPVTLPEAQEMARAAQQTMEIRRFAIDSVRRIVVMNDRISKIRPAQQILEELLYHRPEVMIELEFLEVNRNDLTSFGLTLPTRFPVTYLGDFFRNIVPTTPTGISYLLRFGGGKTVFGLGLADASLVAPMSQSSAKSLLRTRVRSVDGQPATFHVGDKYPILTAGYFGPASFQGPGAYTPPPSFTFEDLGLVVKVTPHVHGEQEVTLEVDTEFKVLAGQSFNGIPVISNRKFTSKVRLKNGEWGIVAGMMTDSEGRSITGLAGLSQLPLLGPLVRQTDKNKDSSQVIIVMKPMLLSVPPPGEVALRPIWVGSETRPLTPM